MYEITVEHTFSAAHAIRIAGAMEPLHGHNWLIRATITGRDLDDDGLLCDFHAIHDRLAAICHRFHNGNLNTIAPFDELNPTAELVARHIADELGRALDRDGRLRVASVSVGEAAGCVATFRPEACP